MTSSSMSTLFFGWFFRVCDVPLEVDLELIHGDLFGQDLVPLPLKELVHVHGHQFLGYVPVIGGNRADRGHETHGEDHRIGFRDALRLFHCTSLSVEALSEP